MVADVNHESTALGAGGNPYTVAVTCAGDEPSTELARCLDSEGVAYTVPEGTPDGVDVVLLDLTDLAQRDVEAMAKTAGASGMPTIAAIGWDQLRGQELRVPTDDVIVVPWRLGELMLRIRRLVERKSPPDSPSVIRAGDLIINPDRYDVYLAWKPVLLTFKEYELLKLLAANPGRVYSREALLEQVWGYRYFGGTRTVDVHVRRLRSKIEDATHTFIDTVWNVGYRFHG